jgi:hypothetical protein
MAQPREELAMTSTFDERLDQLQRALKVIGPVTDNPELQSSAFAWLVGDGKSSLPVPAKSNANEKTDQSGAKYGAGAGSGFGKAKRSSRPANVTPDKSVNLTPTSATEWTDYVAQKSPTNLNDKYAVAVYWLQEMANETPVTIAKIVYLFIAANWNIPASAKNKASAAGAAGFIESGDLQNLSITGLGTARVVNQLPPKK